MSSDNPDSLNARALLPMGCLFALLLYAIAALLAFPPTAHAAGNDAFTKLLLHFDGSDESTTYTPDSSSNNLEIQADSPSITKIDTAQAKFGGTSLSLRSIGAYVYVNADGSTLALASGDWAIDCWIRISTALESTGMA
jgi:hypothetical protein